MELISVKAVAEMLHVSTRHVRRLVDRGAMPASAKLGAVVRWRRDQVEAWIAGGCLPIRTSSHHQTTRRQTTARRTTPRNTITPQQPITVSNPQNELDAAAQPAATNEVN